MPKCWIIAGPNGAGKTTFALEYLANIVKCTHFINADLIAAGLSPLAPEQELITAGKLLLKEIENCINKNKNFAAETTLAGKNYLKLIKRLKAQNWDVDLIYLALPSVELSKERVAERVKHGGHNIPISALERRFSKSLKNLFEAYSKEVDNCVCYINHLNFPEIVFDKNTEGTTVANRHYYDLLKEKASK
ncbi:zeta toxin family protein [Catenovulum adriaticum]|uniref:Zeta toxin family protein n=1 Tax=Catenovulum adriaticum TaxID=2984846 RepID=A0ABY7AKX6_9ALTE|nr:zeta toxin family protein [Catenovulum sp. TS8]WAJ69387.1 zeta toxin family protein [Catenovulum sp. TS8]